MDVLDFELYEFLVPAELFCADSVYKEWLEARIQLADVSFETFEVGIDGICSDFQVHGNTFVFHDIILVLVVIVILLFLGHRSGHRSDRLHRLLLMRRSKCRHWRTTVVCHQLSKAR